MEKDFERLVGALTKLEGVAVIDTGNRQNWIHFSVDSEQSLRSITAVVSEANERHACSLMVMSKQGKSGQSYQLVVDEKDRSKCLKFLAKKFEALVQSEGDMLKAKQKELGLPDLSLLTIKQMAAELKRRQGLTFAIVWIENAERDNIAIEGSGNPTQLVGLLTRGSHMAIEWADKNIKFFKPKDEE